MTDKKPDPMTRTEVGRMIDAEVREELAKLHRPSQAMKAAKAGADFTLRYPLASSVAGLAFIAGGVTWLEGAKMWTLVGVGICLVPGLASKAIEFVGGLRKAKEG